MTSPYENLGETAFWRTGVANRTPDAIPGLYRRKFPISRDMPIATAGSCFAQHIARHLRARGFDVLDREPPPPFMTEQTQHRFGYGLYSARYGNIYTTRHLLQLAEEAFGRRDIAPAALIWEREGRYFDAMRPSVEPEGLDSPEEVLAHRAEHLAAVKGALRAAKLIVFTFGLTEYWEDTRFGLAYPTAPGTIAGQYDDAHFRFRNADAAEVLEQFLGFKRLVELRNPDVRFLLTVSPVPLTATASGRHVLAATTWSKSVLRAVAGQLEQTFGNVDYFPSYELIATPFSGGAFYGPNLRSVRPEGVEAAMRLFFAEHDPDGSAEAAPEIRRERDPDEEAEDAVCEDLLLEAFAPR